MDFTLSEEQEAIADLAGRIFTEKLAPERLREIETDPAGDWFAADVWAELAKSDLLGVCLPESVGGGGYGFRGRRVGAWVAAMRSTRSSATSQMA